MPKRLLFIHHSTGGNLIHAGHLREKLYAKTTELEFWDHGYNLDKHIPLPILKLIANKVSFYTGLSDARGIITDKDFQLKVGNNNPQDYEDIFCSDPNISTTLKQILDFDVIAFKNCFPTAKIKTDEQLQRYKSSYEHMAKCFGNYPDKLFIAFTPPPLRKEVTRLKYAGRAVAFAKWLTSEWVKPENVKVFDFFSLLADSDGYLKRDYVPLVPIDSYPNNMANDEVANIFVSFLSRCLLPYKQIAGAFRFIRSM